MYIYDRSQDEENLMIVVSQFRQSRQDRKIDKKEPLEKFRVIWK